VKEKVLITGGSGLIGRAVIKLLQQENYEPVLLSRNAGKGDIKTYRWNVEKSEIDTEAVIQVNHIIHLAGASVGKRWTKKYKQKIIDSRIKSINLLQKTLVQTNHRLKSFISASAIGYYGNRGNEIIYEEENRGADFLSEVCTGWEAAADEMKEVAGRVVKLRTGIVLSKEGGALPQIMMPMKFRVAIVFGEGEQYYSWIDINDIADMYLFALKNNIEGVFNAVAPNPVTYNQLISAIKKAKHIKTINIKMPLLLARLLLGKFGETLFCSAKVSPDKIQKSGYRFQYNAIEAAVLHLR
jgi:uncharacterized protein